MQVVQTPFLPVCLAGFFGLLSGLITYGASVDDFESYADSAALNAAWEPDAFFPPALILETNEVFEGGQAMKLSGTMSDQPLLLTLFTFVSTQDWTAATSVSIHYKGAATNSPVDIRFQVLNSSSALVVEGQAVEGALASTWQELTVPLSGFTALEDVKQLQIALLGNAAGDRAELTFDDIQLNFPLIAPAMYNLYPTGTVAKVSIDGLMYHHYTLQKNSALISTNWLDQAGPVTGAGSVIEFTLPLTGNRQYFRVRADSTP